MTTRSPYVRKVRGPDSYSLRCTECGVATHFDVGQSTDDKPSNGLYVWIGLRRGVIPTHEEIFDIEHAHGSTPVPALDGYTKKTMLRAVRRGI